MIDFYEFLTRRQKMALPDPLTMLLRAGIDPGGPSEVDVLRMVKRWGKQALATKAKSRVDVPNNPTPSNPNRPDTHHEIQPSGLALPGGPWRTADGNVDDRLLGRTGP